MYLGFSSGSVVICDDRLKANLYHVLNWSQYNIDFKTKPISAIDVIDVGSKFVLVGDQNGQLVILNNREVAYNEQFDEIVAAKWVCALRFVIATKDS
jgi:hypothetical protein